MGDLVVVSVVDGDELLRLRMDTVDGQVEVPVLGVAVERVDGLVLRQAHFVQEHPGRLVSLGGRRLFAFPPAQDPVLDGLGVSLGHLGQADHLLDLPLVVDVQEVQGAPVLDLLAIATGRWSRRCSRPGRGRSRRRTWALPSSTLGPS